MSTKKIVAWSAYPISGIHVFSMLLYNVWVIHIRWHSISFTNIIYTKLISNNREELRRTKKSSLFSDNFRDNPIGMQGNIAIRYGQLVTKLWGNVRGPLAPFELRVCLIENFSSSEHSSIGIFLGFRSQVWFITFYWFSTAWFTRISCLSPRWFTWRFESCLSETLRWIERQWWSTGRRGLDQD